MRRRQQHQQRSLNYEVSDLYEQIIAHSFRNFTSTGIRSKYVPPENYFVRGVARGCRGEGFKATLTVMERVRGSISSVVTVYRFPRALA